MREGANIIATSPHPAGKLGGVAVVGSGLVLMGAGAMLMWLGGAVMSRAEVPKG